MAVGTDAIARCRFGLSVALTLAMAACTTTPQTVRGPLATAGQRIYHAPGTADDPWGPYIQEAATRFSVPDSWIRAVMQQESGGKEYLGGQLTTSDAGAMGLMQLMPETYADMQAQYGLGGDPYEPHDNIMAGTAYIRLMYDRFGAPDFLAAYNAGPERVDSWRQNGTPLPDETVQYVAAITPNLGGGVAPSAPMAAPVMLASADGINANAAYAGGGGGAQVIPAQAAALSRTADGCLRNADAAYDPASPCLMDQDTPHADSAGTRQVASVADDTVSRDAVIPDGAQPVGEPGLPARPAFVQPVSYTAAAHGSWAVQVGAFSTSNEARSALDTTRRMIGINGGQLSAVVMPVPASGGTLYRARLIGFAPADASTACATLHARAMACFAVPDRT
ncbi:MAG: lytic transglycosylase domain-containing protein [Komagataeibacter hansenii]|nr:lytic transglycosylase domain-containing protein [Novacetimonas hansenii]